MKPITLLFSLLFLSFTLFAQNDAKIIEGDLKMSNGQKNAYTLLIKDSKAKDLEKNWSKFMKQYKGKTKRNKKTNEYFTDNAKIKEMSHNTVDVYARFQQQGDNAEVNIWYDLGGAYLSSESHAEQSTAATVMLNKYNNEISKIAIKSVLGGQEKTLKNLDGNLKDLKKEKSKLEEEIAKCEKKIAEAKEKLEQNAIDQKSKNAEIKNQQGTIQGTKDLLRKY